MPGKTTRRNFLKQSSLAAAAAALTTCALPKKRPNIIFLLTDDQRRDMLGCMGNDIIQTPNIDALAADGVIFDKTFVTTSICCTSRASIFTGQYARRHGINDFSTDFSAGQLAQTYPMLLKKVGYRVGFIGKYGVGRRLPKEAYDFWRGVPGQPKYETVDDQGRPIHYTRLAGNQALEFLRGSSGEQPFCLSVSFKAPHVQDGDPRQFIPDPAYADLYRSVDIPTPEKAKSKYFQAMPDFLKDDQCMLRVRWRQRFSTPEMYQEMVKKYYRLITGVDVIVGDIRKELDKRGLAENTVIVLLGDNGFYLGEYGFAGKWLGHEESIRVPLIVFDPLLPKRLRGRRREDMALNIDIAPTLLDIAGVKPPTNMQGKSLLPLIKGKSIPWRDAFFYEHLFKVPESAVPTVGYIPSSIGLRTQQWKYLRYIDYDPVYEELYDLQNDPQETENLADHKEYADDLARLRQQCDEMKREKE